MRILIVFILSLTLLSCTKKEGEGGRSSISGIVKGTEVSAERKEVTDIICVPSLDINDADYWLLNTPGSGSDYFVWYNNVNQGAIAPVFSPERIQIRVDYDESSAPNNILSSTEMAILTEAAFNNLAGSPFSVARNNDVITITNNNAGATADADNGNSNFGVDVATQGKDNISLRNGPFPNEDVFIIYGNEDDIHDDAIKTNYDGTFKFKNLRKGKYRVFAYNEDETISKPLTPVMVEIEIGGKDDADIGTITIEKKND